MTPAKKSRNALTRFCNEAADSKYMGGYTRRHGGSCDLECVVAQDLTFPEAASILGTMLGKYAEEHDWDTAQMLGFLFAVTAARDSVLGAAETEESE